MKNACIQKINPLTIKGYPKKKMHRKKSLNSKKTHQREKRMVLLKKKDNSDSSDEESDRRLSLLPPKLQVFIGDPKDSFLSSFISRFDCVVKRRKWSKKKRLERLFDCLLEKTLE